MLSMSNVAMSARNTEVIYCQRFTESELTLWKRIWQAQCFGYARVLLSLSEMAGSACQIRLNSQTHT